MPTTGDQTPYTAPDQEKAGSEFSILLREAEQVPANRRFESHDNCLLLTPASLDYHQHNFSVTYFPDQNTLQMNPTTTPQALQVAMAILKTRLIRCAQVIDARRSAGVGGSSATLAWLLCRRDQRPMPAVGGKYAMQPGQLHSWFEHQGRPLGNEVQRLKDHMRGAVPVRRLQWVANVAIRCQ